MTESQRLTLQVSEARQHLNGLIEARNKLPDNQEPDAEAIRKLDEATRRVSALETEYRAAIVVEAGEEEQRRAADPDGEEVERRKLLGRASVVPFIMEAVDNKAVTGAEAECRSAVLGDEDTGNQMPIDLLLPPDDVETRSQTEYRADTVTPVDSAALADGSQASVLERIFTRSVAARLGVAMPSVPVGDAVYPIMTSGTTASMATDGTQVDAGAAAFTGHTLGPIRLTAAYLFNSRQTLQLRNFEQILRRDLSAVMSDAMDNQLINGDGTTASGITNVTGFLSELAAPTRPSSADTFASYITKFTGAVDGLNAYQLSDLRTVIGAASINHMYSLYRGANSDLPVYEALRSRIGGMTVSSRIPAPTTTGGQANTQRNIMALTSYLGRNAVAPVWRGLEMIRDPYTNAGKGQVRLTVIAFFNFKILRETGWALWAARTA